MRLKLFAGALATFFLGAAGSRLPAQAKPKLAGVWEGVWHSHSGDQRTFVDIVWHRPGWDGTITLVDKPGFKLELEGVKLDRPVLQFTASGVQGKYRGHLSEDGQSITGKWETGGRYNEWNLTRASPSEAWPVNAAASPEDAHRYLETAARQANLIDRGSAPFHLVAAIDLMQQDERVLPVRAERVDGATLEELWRDPLHWRMTVTFDGSSYTEVDNGRTAYTIGASPDVIYPKSAWAPYLTQIEDVLPRVENALLEPIEPAMLATRHLALNGGCLEAEPELPGIAPELLVASTRYCISPLDLTLHSTDGPSLNGNSGWQRDQFGDDPSSAGGNRAKSIRLFGGGGDRFVQARVTTLEAASDFRTLSEAAPAGAKRFKAHPQEDLWTRRIVYGQILAGQYLEWMFCKDKDYGRGHAGVNLRLHVGTDGLVGRYDVVSDADHVVTPTIAAELQEAMKKFRYRVSYQSGQAAAVDRMVRVGLCIPAD